MNTPSNILEFGPPPADMSAGILELYGYWDGKRASRTMPDRADLDPLSEIPRLLANIWLMDVEHDPTRFRYRLIGSALTRAGALARVGDYLDETQRVGQFDEVLAALERSVDEKLTFWTAGTPRLAHDKFVNRIETLTLPLSVGNPDRVGMIMNMTVYTWRYPV